MSNDIELISDDESDYTDYWIDYFLGMKGNEYFCDVDSDYITDRFNLMGLQGEVARFQLVLQLIVDQLPKEIEGRMPKDEVAKLERDAKKLYGLIHARFIITVKGLHKMYEKYQNADFGKCPRVHCKLTNLLPVGLYDQPGLDSVKLYCPSCEDLYNPKSSRHNGIDGAFFGTTFPGMFLQAFPEAVPVHPMQRYVPKVFGFDLHKNAQLSRWQELQRLKLEKNLSDKGINLVNCPGGFDYEGKNSTKSR